METEILTPQQLRQSNKELLARLRESDDGEVKFASAAGSKMLKRRIYEEGFLRRILPEETVTDDDLTPQLSHEYPCILKEMEGLSKGAPQYGTIQNDTGPTCRRPRLWNSDRFWRNSPMRGSGRASSSGGGEQTWGLVSERR